jgi:hypothetical protein
LNILIQLWHAKILSFWWCGVYVQIFVICWLLVIINPKLSDCHFYRLLRYLMQTSYFILFTTV